MKILNLVRLDRKLKQLPEAAKVEIRAAMEKAANEMVATMKSLVPVSEDGSHGNPPGTLRDSIGWTWGKIPRGASIIAIAKSRLSTELTLTIYAGSKKAFYARWQEFGTQKMRPNPYFYVSYRAHKNSAKRRIRAATRKAARRVANR